jgi:integrase
MIKQLIEEEGWALLGAVKPKDVERFLRHVALDVSPQRANKYLAYIKALFNKGMALELISYNPAAHIQKFPEPRKAQHIPSLEDIKRVMTVCTEEQRDYLWFLALTACRCGEANSLKRTDVDLAAGMITIGTRKSKDGNIAYRKILMGQALATIVARRIAIAKKSNIDYVFFNSRMDEPFNYRSKFLRNKCVKAKVQPFTYHCLRHFASMAMDRAGVPLTDIQQVLGHQRPTTTDIYLSSIKEVKATATEAIEKAMEGAR